MKKIKFAFFAVLILSSGVFSSCDKDEEEEEINFDPELIGYWMREDTFEEIINVEQFTFNEDLTGIYIMYEKGDTTELATPTTYTVKNNNISITLLSLDSTISGSYTFSMYTASFERLHLTIDGKTNAFSKMHVSDNSYGY